MAATTDRAECKVNLPVFPLPGAPNFPRYRRDANPSLSSANTLVWCAYLKLLHMHAELSRGAFNLFLRVTCNFFSEGYS